MNSTMWPSARFGFPAIQKRNQGGRWVRVLQPQPMATPARPQLSERAAAILGDNGLTRFREFSTYKAGWDFGHGLPLSPGSMASLEQFLENYNRFQRRPSLFFTREGYLALGWEAEQERDIELEFAPGHFVLYLASGDTEITIDRENLPSLLALLPRTPSRYSRACSWV